MLTTVAVKNLSVNIVLIRASASVLDRFLMRELSELGIHLDIAKLVYMIREVTQPMHFNKVEIGFGIDHVYTEVVLIIQIGFQAPAPLGPCHSHVALGWRML